MTDTTDQVDLTYDLVTRAVRELGGEVETNLQQEAAHFIVTALDAANEALGAGDTDGAQPMLYLAMHTMTFLFAGGGPGANGGAAYQWATICSDIREGKDLEIEVAYFSFVEFIEMAGAEEVSQTTS